MCWLTSDRQFFGHLIASVFPIRQRILNSRAGARSKETTAIKVVVVEVTFGIIVQFVFLLAGAR